MKLRHVLNCRRITHQLPLGLHLHLHPSNRFNIDPNTNLILLFLHQSIEQIIIHGLPCGIQGNPEIDRILIDPNHTLILITDNNGLTLKMMFHLDYPLIATDRIGPLNLDIKHLDIRRFGDTEHERRQFLAHFAQFDGEGGFHEDFLVDLVHHLGQQVVDELRAQFLRRVQQDLLRHRVPVDDLAQVVRLRGDDHDRALLEVLADVRELLRRELLLLKRGQTEVHPPHEVHQDYGLQGHLLHRDGLRVQLLVPSRVLPALLLTLSVLHLFLLLDLLRGVGLERQEVVLQFEQLLDYLLGGLHLDGLLVDVGQEVVVVVQEQLDLGERLLLDLFHLLVLERGVVVLLEVLADPELLDLLIDVVLSQQVHDLRVVLLPVIYEEPPDLVTF